MQARTANCHKPIATTTALIKVRRRTSAPFHNARSAISINFCPYQRFATFLAPNADTHPHVLRIFVKKRTKAAEIQGLRTFPGFFLALANLAPAVGPTSSTSNSRRGFLGRPGFPVLSRGELAAWGGEGIAEVAIVRWCVFMLADAVGRARRPSDTLVLYWKSFGFVRAALSYPLGTVGTSTN